MTLFTPHQYKMCVGLFLKKNGTIKFEIWQHYFSSQTLITHSGQRRAEVMRSSILAKLCYCCRFDTSSLQFKQFKVVELERSIDLAQCGCQVRVRLMVSSFSFIGGSFNTNS